MTSRLCRKKFLITKWRQILNFLLSYFSLFFHNDFTTDRCLLMFDCCTLACSRQKSVKISLSKNDVFFLVVAFLIEVHFRMSPISFSLKGSICSRRARKTPWSTRWPPRRRRRPTRWCRNAVTRSTRRAAPSRWTGGSARGSRSGRWRPCRCRTRPRARSGRGRKSLG